MVRIDFRFDPFLFQFRPKNITGEPKTVEFFPAFRRCGFFLSETPQRLTSAPIRVVCGGDTLGEVSRISPPGVNNFRVDYGNVNNFASTGFVEVHADRLGQSATINYRGLGANLNASHRSDAKPNIQRSIVTPKSAILDSVFVSEPQTFEVASGIFNGENRLRNVADAVALTDAVSKQRLLAALAANDAVLRDTVKIIIDALPRSAQYFSSSGTWTRPTGVRYVFSIILGTGGGGGGGTGGRGGGGGGCAIGIHDLGASPSPTYAVTVGTGGDGGSGPFVAGLIGGASSFLGLSALGGTGGEGSFGGSAAGVGGSGSGSQNLFYRFLTGGNGQLVFGLDGGFGGGGAYVGGVGTNGGAGGSPGGQAGGDAGNTAGGGGAGGGNGGGVGGNGGRGAVVVLW